MADINFLSSKNNGLKKDENKKEKKKPEIKWTHSSEAGSASLPGIRERGNKNKTGLFSFFKKEKKKPAADLEKKDSWGELMDAEKIKKSREEVLKLIKEKDGGEQPAAKKDKSKKHKNFFHLSGLLKRKKGNGEKNKDKKESKENKDKKAGEVVPADIFPEKDVKEKRDGGLVKKYGEPKEKIKKPSWAGKLVGVWRAMFSKRKKTALKKEIDILADKNPVKIMAAAPDDEKNNNEINQGNNKKDKEEAKEERTDEPRKTGGLEVREAEEWDNPEILETNLIRGELTTFFNWKRGLTVLSIYIFISCFIIAAIYGGLVFWGGKKKSEKIEIVNKLDDLNSKIKPLEKEAEKIIAVQKKISMAIGILNSHIYWTNFFEFLEDNTLADVYYFGGFSGDNKGQYSFAANTKNFRTILEQVNLMRANEHVKNVSVSGGNVTSSVISDEEENSEPETVVQGVDFNLELEINPDLFTLYK